MTPVLQGHLKVTKNDLSSSQFLTFASAKLFHGSRTRESEAEVPYRFRPDLSELVRHCVSVIPNHGPDWLRAEDGFPQKRPLLKEFKPFDKSHDYFIQGVQLNGIGFPK